MSYPIKAPKKLIEVALPLDAINEASAREKSIRHGHPSTLHLWWARRPLAAARAVIFAQMVNDPGYERYLGRGVNKEKAALERERLFELMKELVKWENTNNAAVLARAREEIWKSWRETCALNRGHPQAAELFNPEKLPAFHDPFAGGGALPLEAQRLGLNAYASDLNPVAVTINKAMIEIPPRFAGRKPVGPIPPSEKQADLVDDWSGASGLAEDVRRYGAWMRSEAQKRIGHLYPKIEITSAVAENRPDLKPLIGQKLTVIAWIWARTVKSPNPAFSHVTVPLASTFVLSSKDGKESYVEPIIEGNGYRFAVSVGTPPEEAKSGTKANGHGANFRCLMSGGPISGAYIKAEGQAGRIGARLMAIVAEGERSRIYLAPTEEHEHIAGEAKPGWKPDVEFFQQALGFRVGNYGMTKWSDLFTSRQLVAMTAFSDLVGEAIERCRRDVMAAGLANGEPLIRGGRGALAYAQAVGVYLGFALDKMADLANNLCTWEPIAQCPRHLFGRQAIPFVWDFAEGNVLGSSSGSWSTFVDGIHRASLKAFNSVTPEFEGHALQADAQTQGLSARKVISTDPPYYDNIGYSDLSDFFFVWMRRSLKSVFPELYGTLITPKAEELVATPSRHGGYEQAERFFMNGMTDTMRNLAEQAHPSFPVTIYYAFKQSETNRGADTSSTGWESFLEAVLKAGLSVLGTWPMRTENGSRLRGQVSNALASSIVLVCRKSPPEAATATRREFLRELNAVLPEALEEMTRGGVNSPVAPVDLSQAIIGPGMAIFSQYSAVLEADGTPMSVRTALQLINRFLADDEFDHDTHFCLRWFEEQGWATGKFGDADVLARAHGTSVGGLIDAGVVASGRGELRLLRWAEMPRDWSPDGDSRTPVWEALHQLIRALNQEGEGVAGAMLARMPARAEPVRALAYRLYTVCERRGWAEDARAYNELVTAWSGIEQAAAEEGLVGQQVQLGI